MSDDFTWDTHADWASQGLTPLYSYEYYPVKGKREKEVPRLRGGGGYVQRTPPRGKRVGYRPGSERKSVSDVQAREPAVEVPCRVERLGVLTPVLPQEVDPAPVLPQEVDPTPLSPTLAHPGVYQCSTVPSDDTLEDITPHETHFEDSYPSPPLVEPLRPLVAPPERQRASSFMIPNEPADCQRALYDYL